MMRKMQLITPTTKIVTTGLVKNCNKKKDVTKNTKKNAAIIEEDIGAADDSSICSHDSWLARHMQTLSMLLHFVINIMIYSTMIKSFE